MTEITEGIERKIRYLNGDTSFSEHMIKAYEVEQILQGLKLIELVENKLLEEKKSISYVEITNVGELSNRQYRIHELESLLEESKK